MTARRSLDVAGKIAFVLWRHGQRHNGTMPTMRAVLLCLLLLGAHEYPVLDRRPGSNDLELDLRWICPVLCPSLYVVIDYFSHSCLKMCKICLKRTLDATFFFRLFGVDVLWRHRWITFGMGLSQPAGWDNISPDIKIGGLIESITTLWKGLWESRMTSSSRLENISRGRHALI